MSIDKFDYAEPKCTSCGGKEFYYPDKKEVERIPVSRIVEKVDEYFAINDYKSAGNLLEYWKKEAVENGDERGELSMLSELTGYYRKVMDKEKSEGIVSRILQLLDKMNLRDSVSGATILLNVATNKKAFGMAKEAIEIYKGVEQVYNNHLDSNDERFGGLYNNFALSISDLGDYALAKTYFDKALNIMKNVENGDTDSAITYCNLAIMYLNENPLADAQADEMLDKAMECLNNPTIPHNGYYAFVCEKCAAAFSDCGRFMEADELKGRAKGIYERN